ncbi:MAG: polyphosphate kinase 2 family protein, partial [Oscillospiraceae bacterium]|nr:polyphosphate kinase 2 family protein [Oscillospiraceae bacterium]
MLKEYRYDGSRDFKLSKVSTSETSLASDRKIAEAKMHENFDKIQELQDKLYADQKEGVIFLFQAMDAAGKDGTIKAVLTCLTPHGVHETAFKAPSSVELAHDYLWRVEQCVPSKGHIAIFNRSHYEDVLIYRVKKLWKTQAHAERIDPKEQLEHRYEDICNYEKYLWNNSVRTVKIFLNVSKKEQAKRFLSRIEEPEKNWKFSGSDFEERKYWDDYQEAFEEAINKTAGEDTPWYVVPADHKWYMRYVVSEIILATLLDMDPHYPTVTEARLKEFEGYREVLEKEAGKKKNKD